MNFLVDIVKIKDFDNESRELKIPLIVKLFLIIVFAILVIITIPFYPFLFLYEKIIIPIKNFVLKSFIVPIKSKYFNYEEKQNIKHDLETTFLSNYKIKINASPIDLFSDDSDVKIIRNDLYETNMIVHIDDIELFKITKSNVNQEKFENRIVSDFLLDRVDGFFLQEFIIYQDNLRTNLIFYNYETKEISIVKEIGNYILFLDKHAKITGVNNSEEIRILVQEIHK